MTDNNIEEYKDLSTNIRERHTTIWHCRNIYTFIMVGLVGLTYNLKSDDHPLILTSLVIAVCALVITCITISIELRYAKIRNALYIRLIELENVLGFAQYSRIKAQQVTNPILFGKRPYIIYILLAVIYIAAILLRGAI
jgi:hypothetical protein